MSMTVTGRQPDGSQHRVEIACYWTQHVPVSKVFAKQQLDYMCAEKWLTGHDVQQSERLKADIVKVSTENSVPCRECLRA
jgi:hypothetical protein